jgi:nucleoside-diphosphate-sugar epimerase
VLVTGATGFVGRPLVAHLAACGWEVIAGVRSLPPPAQRVSGVQYASVGDVGPDSEWGEALRGATHVVHAAARVHNVHPVDGVAFVRVNEQGTAWLAEQAAVCGVQRFVLLSSIKVNGEATFGRPFRAEDAPNPGDAYARSKLAAEQAVWRVSQATPLEGVVIRLPLVYGPDAKANVARLVRLVDSGLPLPFRSIDNRRSLLALGNLCDFVALALEHPRAAGRVWLLSDGEDVSTAQIVRQVASARHRPARLVPCPPALLRVLGHVAGRSAEVARLTGSLQVDSEPARSELGWRPPFSMSAGLAATSGCETLTPLGASTTTGGR